MPHEGSGVTPSSPDPSLLFKKQSKTVSRSKFHGSREEIIIRASTEAYFFFNTSRIGAPMKPNSSRRLFSRYLR